MRQAQPPLEPGAVVLTKLLHLHPGVGTADDGGQGQEENGRKRVPAGMGAAGIRHLLQTTPQGRGQTRGHEGNSMVSTRSPDLDKHSRNTILRLPWSRR